MDVFYLVCLSYRSFAAAPSVFFGFVPSSKVNDSFLASCICPPALCCFIFLDSRSDFSRPVSSFFFFGFWFFPVFLFLTFFLREDRTVMGSHNPCTWSYLFFFFLSTAFFLPSFFYLFYVLGPKWADLSAVTLFLEGLLFPSRVCSRLSCRWGTVTTFFLWRSPFTPGLSPLVTLEVSKKSLIGNVCLSLFCQSRDAFFFVGSLFVVLRSSLLFSPPYN